MVADSAGRMAWGVDDFADFEVAHVAYVRRDADGGVFSRHLIERVAEHHRIFAMDINGKIREKLLQFGDSRNVVEVGVSEENRFRLETFFLEKRGDTRTLVSGIYDPRFAVFGDYRTVNLVTSNLYSKSFHDGKYIKISDVRPTSQSEKTVILMRRGDKYGMISVSLLNVEF